MKKRVLLIDNDSDFLEIRREPLEKEGFEVLTALSLEQARDVLHRRHVHLASVDVRMVDDDSPVDTSGLALVHDPEFAHVVKIVLTGYHFEAKAVRDAMRPKVIPQHLPDAVDYLSKEEGPEAMIQVINEAITHYSGINWALALEWPHPSYEDGLANWLEPDLPRDAWRERGEELVDLMAMTFADYDRAHVTRLLWRDGPRLALAVTAWKDDAIVGRIVVVRCLPAAPTPAAAERAPDGHAQLIRPARPARTLHYAADLYELPGGRLSEARTLRQFYADSKPAALGECVTGLLATGLAPWDIPQLADDSTPADERLRAHAGLSPDTPDTLGRALLLVGEAAARAGLATFTLTADHLLVRSRESNYDLPNPAAWLARPGPGNVRRPLSLGESCGAPPADTVLVADGRTWLTDFSRAGHAPLLSSLADLETQFTTDLHPFANVTQFGDAMTSLLRPDELAQRPDAPMPELRKLFAAVQPLRERAADYGGVVAYYRALFYHTARRLPAMPLDGPNRRQTVLPALCACLGLGLLARRIDEFEEPGRPPVHPGLWVDKPSRRWFLDDVPLPKPADTPFRFLLYLWENRRRHCENAAIMAAIDCDQMDPNYPSVLVKQLRKFLGPSGMRIIVNSGKGYTLYPDGRPDQAL